MKTKRALAFLLSLNMAAVSLAVPDSAEVAAFFSEKVYGTMPPAPARLTFELLEEGPAFGTLATRRQYRIRAADARGEHSFAVLVYLPAGRERAAPAFVYPNFSGNHTLSADEKVFVEEGPVFNNRRFPRGGRADRVPVERVLSRGFAFVTYCYAALFPDPVVAPGDASAKSVYALFPPERLKGRPLAHPAWAWGAMRVRDLVATLPEIDPSHVAIAGQSRMGKNAIVVGVNDPRFALVCANCGGTKPLKHLPNLLFPHWFADGLSQYVRLDRTRLSETELETMAGKFPDPPFQQSDYLGLIAPRALYVGAAAEDRWQLSTTSERCVRAALRYFERYGKTIGFHVKEGPHSLTAADWERFMDYALGPLGWHSAFSPAVPSDNPDDQLRFFWQAHPALAPTLARFGFNTVIDPAAPKDIVRFQAERLDFVKALGSCVSTPALMKKYPRTNRDGTKWERTVDALDPAYRAEVHDRFAVPIAQLAELKGARVGIQPASELRIRTRPSHTPLHAAAFKAATGLDVPPEADGRAAPHWSKLRGIPADRAIDDNHPVLAYYRWFWKEGDGFGAVFADAVTMAREKLGYVPFSFMDPAIRVPPLWCACPALSHLNQWQVVSPVPYQHSYIISELKAMARGTPGQRTMVMVQGIFARWEANAELLDGVDGRTISSPSAWTQDRPFGLYVTPPPDMFRESLWAALSRQTDGVGFHGWNCLFDGVPFGDSKLAKGYVFTNGETTNVIDEVFNRVAKPLGPLFKAADERAAEVAVLESYTSALLSGKAPWDWKLAGFHCGVAATAANLAPYTLYEEEIARFGIPLSVKVILAPQCEIITKTTAAALRAFRARGGKILADGSHAPAIVADGDLPKDPAALAAAVRPFVAPHVTTDRPTLLVNARCAGPAADLVFVLNDNRTFGDYIGQWRRLRERGLPEKGTVTIQREAAAVYDLERHAPVPFRVEGERTLIPVSFATSGGKALFVVSKPLGKLEVVRTNADLIVRAANRDVLWPVGLVGADGLLRAGVVRAGLCRFAEAPEDARVIDFVTGAIYP